MNLEMTLVDTSTKDGELGFGRPPPSEEGSHMHCLQGLSLNEETQWTFAIMNLILLSPFKLINNAEHSFSIMISYLCFAIVHDFPFQSTSVS